jgi:hypothetical protein
MPRVRARLLDRIAGIRAQLALVEQGVPPGDAFPPRPASQCATCPVAVLCPAAAPYTTALTPWTAPTHPLAPDAPPAAAQAVGEALLAAEAATTLAKTQLKAWVEQQGQPVRAGDRAWDWYTNQERHVTDTAQRDALLADALAAGADAAVVDSVPSTNVTALLRVARSLKKTHPPLAQALEGLVSTQPGTRLFTHRRIPDPKEATRVQDLA